MSSVSHPWTERDGQSERWRPKIVRQPRETRDIEAHAWRERQGFVSINNSKRELE